MNPRDLLSGSFAAAVAAVRAEAVLPRHLPTPPRGRTVVVGAGKAAADMAACVERHWPSEAPLSGLVVTRHGHAVPTRRIRVAEAGHPLPDSAGVEAAGRILSLLREVGPGDRVIGLVSGGGSSLLTLPVGGITLGEIAAVSRALLHSGAPVQAINVVRRHLSLSLGGRLTAACQAPLLALIVSDVVGDEPADIASGPFAPDPSTCADALDVLERWSVRPAPSICEYLRLGLAQPGLDTPKPGNACFDRVENRIVATGRSALLAGGEYLRERGVTPVILGDGYGGMARELAGSFAALIREIRLHASPWSPPVALLSGGEATVRVGGAGRGGRNGEFLLGLARQLDGMPGVHVLAADTDGIDGSGDNAGAFVAPDTLARATAMGLDPIRHQTLNDSYGFFQGLGDLLMTGPTLTNVNDYRVVLIT